MLLLRDVRREHVADNLDGLDVVVVDALLEAMDRALPRSRVMRRPPLRLWAVRFYYSVQKGLFGYTFELASFMLFFLNDLLFK